MAIPKELLQNVQEYAQRRGLELGHQLGFGVHGTVFVGKFQPDDAQRAAECAIKVHHRETDYIRERDVYLRLQDNGVNAIHGCQVPELLGYADDLLVIEMTVVTRPFVLDFAGAFLDFAPDFSDEVMADWRAEKIEQFGARWHEVEAIIWFLKGLGIHLVDVTPNNISLPPK